MKTIIKDYGLRFYVRDAYPTNAHKRGGETFKPFYKKDLKHFQIRVRCAINMSNLILNKVDRPFSNN